MAENDKQDVSNLANNLNQHLNVNARVFVPSFGGNTAASPTTASAPAPTTNAVNTFETSTAATIKADPESSNSGSSATKSPDRDDVADDWEANADEDDEEEEAEGEGEYHYHIVHP